ncbi:MAG: carboxylating nicotinate-nucleotide diphosphorylase [Candidatus Sericytochromatia bacterium]|nr:carboxylating nicotinate-nucleotide diphosphorylase [Candidatus Sericytochromatia bacterium]
MAYDLTQTPDLWYVRNLTLDPAYVNQRIAWFLAEDMPLGDITVESTIDPETQSVAHVLAAQDMVFAGAQILPHFFSEDTSVELKVADGEAVEPGTVLAVLRGPAQELLMRERVMLNLLQRLCGIATITRKYVSLDAPPGFKLLDTRKTTPGLRLFEKYAVSVGGGYNHRRDLSSVAMIKDNHLVAAGGVQAALERVKETNPEVGIELEVDSLEQLKVALEMGGMDAVLLDNMAPETIQAAVAMVRSHPTQKDLFLEASGGITYETLPNYLWTGVNGISIGALTTQARNVDIKLDFV